MLESLIQTLSGGFNYKVFLVITRAAVVRNDEISISLMNRVCGVTEWGYRVGLQSGVTEWSYRVGLRSEVIEWGYGVRL